MKSRLKWASHEERMGEAHLAKTADAQKVEGKRRQGRPRMQWEDCVKRGTKRVRGEWRTTAKVRSWRLVIVNAVREK